MRLRGGFFDLAPPRDRPRPAYRITKNRSLHPRPDIIRDAAAGDPTLQRRKVCSAAVTGFHFHAKVIAFSDNHHGTIVPFGFDGSANDDAVGGDLDSGVVCL